MKTLSISEAKMKLSNFMKKGILEDYLICHPFKRIAKFDNKSMLELNNNQLLI